MSSFFRRFSQRKSTTKQSASEPIDAQQSDGKNGTAVVSAWQLHDAVTIYSASVDAHCPGVIVEIDHQKQQMVVRYWELQTLDIKHKVQPFTAPNVQRRHYESKEDPWNIPIDPPNHDHLSAHHIQAAQEYLSAYPHLFDQAVLQKLDIPRWYTNFQTFLKEKKALSQRNLFIKLISAYLTDSVQGWLELFNKYVFTMLLFQQQSNGDSQALEMKIKILFDMLNVGSANIDRDSLGILCLLYTKSMMNPHENPESPRKETLSKEELLQRKKQITGFAQHLVEQILSWDDTIDMDDFKQLISESPQMMQMLEPAVNAAPLRSLKSIAWFQKSFSSKTLQ